MYTSDVNDAKLLVFDVKPRLSFSGKKTNPSLDSKNELELRLSVTETETASCFRFDWHNLHH